MRALIFTSDRIVIVHMLQYLCGLLVTTGQSLTSFYLAIVRTMTDNSKNTAMLASVARNNHNSNVLTALQHLMLYLYLAI